MKIAFVSYEYPPDTARGGIGTYTYQVAQMLIQLGHQVEVFTASAERSGLNIEDGISVHRIQIPRSLRGEFPDKITGIFEQRHNQVHFDVVEGSELAAETCGIAQKLPEIARVVKLHTPTFLVQQLNYTSPSLKMQLRRYAGAIRRGQWPIPFPQLNYDCEQDPERLFTLSADEITTPSKVLGDLLIEQWRLPRERVKTVPNPFVPSSELLSIPVSKECDHTITFVGRLEKRKGILDLIKAIPLVLKHHPDAKFRFVGETGLSPEPPETMHSYSCRQLHPYLKSLDFTGAIPLKQIPQILSETSICVFPSLWENFPNVCLEAMAAGRGIVASRAGGMANMLNEGEVGYLIDPQKPQQLANALIKLLDNPIHRWELGISARERVLTEYTPKRIAELQIDSYHRAIQHKQKSLQKSNSSIQSMPNLPAYGTP